MWRIRRLLSTEEPYVFCREELQRKAMRALDNKYDCLAIIAKGTYSNIIVLWSRSKKTIVAAKVMHPKMSSKGELKLWPRLRHYNIMPVLKIIHRMDVDIYLMPHYSRTLMDNLDDPQFRRNSSGFSLTTHWIKGILRGLEYIHKSNICHLDIKADNIMITDQNVAVIGDFGSIQSANDLTNRYALPIYYCPPEAWPLKLGESCREVEGKAFDIWSVGMIMLYCFSDRWMESHLWGRTNWWDEIFPLISRFFKINEFYEMLYKAFPVSRIGRLKSSYCMNLLKGVLRYNPKERPTPTEILQHALLQRKGTHLLEPDVIWTYENEEAYGSILKAKLNRILMLAALEVKSIPAVNEEEGEVETESSELRNYFEIDLSMNTV